MSIFLKHMQAAAMEAGDDTVVLVPEIDAAPVSPVDPLDPITPAEDAGVDQFAEQRARRNAETAGDVAVESLVQENEPVDGEDEDMTIGKTDSDVDLPEGEFNAQQELDQELDQFEQEETQIDLMQSELGMLVDSAIAIESFGINPTALAIMQTTGLLDNTALSSLALESVGFYDGNHAEAQMALEGLGDKIKEKAAAMSAKIMSVVKSAGDKVLAVLNPLFDKITSVSKKLASASWDKAKEAGAVIKAHPYATVAAFIAAIAAVGAVVALTASGAPAPGAKIEAIQAFLKKIAADISKIKFPGGKIMATVNEAGTKIALNVSKAAGVVKDAATTGAAAVKAGAGSAAAIAKSSAGAVNNTAKEGGLTVLGWSKAAVSASSSQLDRAWASVKTGWTALGARAVKVGAAAVNGVEDFVTKPSMAAGLTVRGAMVKRGVGPLKSAFVGGMVGGAAQQGILMAIVSVISVMFALTRAVVVGGFRAILATYRALTGQTGMTATA